MPEIKALEAMLQNYNPEFSESLFNNLKPIYIK
jgi:hypothetical protein